MLKKDCIYFNFPKMSLSPTPTIFSPFQSSRNSGDLPKIKLKKKKILTKLKKNNPGLNILFHCLKTFKNYLFPGLISKTLISYVT